MKRLEVILNLLHYAKWRRSERIFVALNETRFYSMKDSFKRNLTVEKKFETKQNFTIEKSSLKRNEISFLIFFHRHFFMSASSFKTACDDGEWPLGVFNAACV